MSRFLRSEARTGCARKGLPRVDVWRPLSCGARRRRQDQEPGVKLLAVAGGALPIEPPVTTESITRSCSKNTEKPL